MAESPAEAESPAPPARPIRPSVFSALAILVGIIAGLGAVFFRDLIAFFHNLLFLGRLSLQYDASQHAPVSPWGPW
ncbi:MAG: hypothetical protein NTW86_02700 [Candidatus Sumerlaeota bacterium]|nr:hypothetical protein [Candidatus Sumerlaeota bacterium]